MIAGLKIAGGAMLAALLALLAQPAAASAPHPLFADDAPLRLTLRGPIAAIVRAAERNTDAHPATLTVEGAAAETHAIRLSARGVSRRRHEVCEFPPLRIELAAEPPAASLLRGQRRLKLVTHCRGQRGFERHLLLEYAAYRLFNVLTPLSFRVRLAEIAYAEPDGRPSAPRLGFLIEDVDDLARRNGLVEIDTERVPLYALDADAAARFAVFQYLIGNFDWAMHRGLEGEGCCHNARLLGAAPGAAAELVPVPFDFDHSGLVGAPYAVVPPQVSVARIGQRRYRGFCRHNAAAQAAAAEALAARPRLEAALASVPRLDERTRARAAAYLADSLDDLATPAGVADKLLGHCLD